MTAVTTMIDRMRMLAEKTRRLGNQLQTEEAIKTALVMPFLVALGYDVFSPEEVVPAYVVSSEDQEDRVDYAIKRNGQVVMLVKMEQLGTELEADRGALLQRYFATNSAPILLLTNGVRYLFFSDLEEQSALARRPFLDLDLLALRESLVPELSRLAKDVFDPDEWVAA